MSCNKGGFINIRHNYVGDLTAKLLSEVRHDVQVEPTLLPLAGEWMEHCTTIEPMTQVWTFKQEYSRYEDSKDF